MMQIDVCAPSEAKVTKTGLSWRGKVARPGGLTSSFLRDLGEVLTSELINLLVWIWVKGRILKDWHELAILPVYKMILCCCENRVRIGDCSLLIGRFSRKTREIQSGSRPYRAEKKTCGLWGHISENLLCLNADVFVVLLKYEENRISNDEV